MAKIGNFEERYHLNFGGGFVPESECSLVVELEEFGVGFSEVSFI
tara:strand:- start:197 stop:331 length:135 start_codon:yes stop_codon:yes gene_type:complete